MFDLTYSTPHKGEIKTLVFEKEPSSLGENEDMDGNIWSIWGIYGIAGQIFVHARLVVCRKSTSPCFYENECSSLIVEEYLPYKVEVKRGDS